MKTSRIAYAGLALIACLLSLCLFSCSRNVGQPDARPNASLVSHPLGVDTSKAGIPPFASKPALLPRIADAIGLSTPEGRARRQAVKLAKATAPKVGKGGVLAINSNVSSGYKSRAPVTTADTGATVSNAAENSQQQNVQGDGNQVSAKQANPTQEAPGPLAVIADNLSGPLGAVLGLAAAAGIVVFLLRRKAAKTIV